MLKGMSLRIGIDFDNTIVDYRSVFLRAARGLGLIDETFADEDKTAIRDRLRARAGGELQWQQLQAHVYGIAIAAAPAYPGLERFSRLARERGATLAIVSHKSRFAAAAPDGADMRVAALQWLTAAEIVGDGGIAPAEVYFETTRAEKIARIHALDLTHFIDDLEDVLNDPAFPPHTRAIHFRASWDDVTADVFG